MTHRRSSDGRSPAARRRWRGGAAALALALGCAAAPRGNAQAAAPRADRVGVAVADFIAEASQRAGIPQSWIAAVIRAESAFDPRAISPKGAMGLMQLMPDTWAGLRGRLGLGPDPYDPHDNILAGAGYLRELYDEFGVGGFLAAYNAGPARYLDFLTRGRPLPAETRAYVARIALAIDGEPAVARSARPSAPALPSQSSLFVALGAPPNGASVAPLPGDDAPVAATPAASPDRVSPLFAGPWRRSR